MDKRNIAIIAFGGCIAVGLIIGACILGNAYKVSKRYDRVVNVRGLCEMEVKADQAICPFVYKEGGDDLKVLYERVEKNNNIIIQFLKDAGIKDDEITVAAPTLSDRTADWNNSYRYDYVITSVITVCTNNVDEIVKLDKRKGELLLKGIPISETWEHSTSYDFTHLNDIKPEMIKTATKNARSTAEKFAEDSDSKLGKIKTAYQGQFSIYNRDENTPYIKIVRVVSSIDYYLND